MSGTTIHLTVTPGAQTAAALAARRGALLERRRVRIQEITAQPQTRSRARRVPAELAVLAARRQAVRITAPATQAADAALREAHDRPAVAAIAKAQRAVAAAERAEELRELARAQQELLLEQLLANLPQGMAARPGVQRSLNGTLVARMDIAGAGHIGLALDEGGQVALEMTDAAVDEMVTADGTVAGCDAEQALAARITAGWQDAGFVVAIEAAEERTRDRISSMRQRSAP
jgi:hypothetical protein